MTGGAERQTHPSDCDCDLADPGREAVGGFGADFDTARTGRIVREGMIQVSEPNACTARGCEMPGATLVRAVRNVEPTTVMLPADACANPPVATRSAA